VPAGSNKPSSSWMDHFGDFFSDCSCRLARIRGGGNGPPNNKIIGDSANGLAWCADSCLIILTLRAALRRTDARHHDEEISPAGSTNLAYFFRRSHHAVQSRSLRQLRKTKRPRRRSASQSNTAQVLRTQTRQYGDPKQLGPVRALACKHLRSGPHHRFAASRMHVQQSNFSEFRRGRNRSDDSIRYIVVFQIQEDAGTKSPDLPHGIRAGGCEQLNVDLEHPNEAGQVACHIERLVQAAEVERQDYFVAGWGTYGSGGSSSSSMRTRPTPLPINPSRVAAR